MTKWIRRSIASFVLALLLASAFILPAIATSQSPSIEWQKTYGGFSGDSLVQTADEGFAIAATAVGGYGTHNEIKKMDREGNLALNITIGDSPISNQWIMATLDGGFAVARRSDNSSIAASLVKVDAEGKVQWNQTYEFGYESYLNHAIQTQDGFALIGSISMPERTWNPTWIIKTDSVGIKHWNITCDNFTGSLIAESNGGYVFAGDSGGQDAWLFRTHLAKIDYSGSIEWERAYEDQLGYRPRSLLPKKDGGFILAGAKYLQNGSVSAFAMEIDAQGNLDWTKTYGENSGFRITRETNDGYLFAGGIYDDQQHYSARLLKTDSFGNEEWETSLAGQGNGYLYSLVQTQDEGYAFTGATGPTDSTSTEIWLVKIAPTNNEPTQPNWTIIVAIILFFAIIAVLFILLYRWRKKQ